MRLMTTTWKTLLAMPLALLACSLVTACSDDDAVLGSAAITDPTVATTVPSTPITTGNYAGTTLVIPPNAVPANTNVTVAPSGVDLTTGPTGTAGTFDVSAGPTVTVSLTPAGTTLNPPGATLTLPFDPAKLVAQGFAATEAALTTAIVESAITVLKVSDDGLTTTTLTPVAGSANLTTKTFQISGLLSFSKFQGITDMAPAVTSAATLPNAKFFDPTAYSAQLTAEGGVGATRVGINGTGSVSYTWSVAAGSTLPDSMTLSPSGLLSGSPTTTADPTVAADVSFTLEVADITGRKASKLFNLHIDAAGLPVITTTAIPSATTGEAYSFQIGVVGAGQTDPTQYTFHTTGLPANGMDIVTAMGTDAGKLMGTPSAATDVAFTVAAEHSSVAGVSGPSKSFTLKVYDPVEILTTELPGAEDGIAYSQTLSATGGNGTYTWSLLSGVLPNGITLNAATGVISGTPPAMDSQSFVVCAEDTDSTALVQRMASMPLSILFDQNPVADTINIAGTSGTVTVMFTVNDPDGTAASRYTATFEASDNCGGTYYPVTHFTPLNGANLSDLSDDQAVTVEWNTSFSTNGDKINPDGLIPTMVLRITLTDNTVGNAGMGIWMGPINNSQSLNTAATSIIGQRVLGTPGNTVQVQVRMVAGTGHSPAGIGYDLNYDPAVLTYATGGYADGAATTAAGKGGSASNPGGNKVRVVIFGLNANVIADGVISTITFTVNSAATAQDVALAINAISVSDPSATAVTPTEGVSGQVVVQ